MADGRIDTCKNTNTYMYILYTTLTYNSITDTQKHSISKTSRHTQHTHTHNEDSFNCKHAYFNAIIQNIKYQIHMHTSHYFKLLEVKLPYEPVCPSVRPSIGWSKFPKSAGKFTYKLRSEHFFRQNMHSFYIFVRQD